MERVLVEVAGAADLVGRLAAAEREVEEANTRVRRLIADGSRRARVAFELSDVERWAEHVADDLRWRLDWLADVDRPGPSLRVDHLGDGTVEAWFPIDAPDDLRRWERGAALHDDLVAALDAIDGQAADELLDQVLGLRDDPLALAGFASVLGTTGMADIVRRIDRAKQEDPRDTFAELVGGSNPRWDSLKAEVAALAGELGGLAAYGADDPVEVHLEGGGLQVWRLRDLLLADPMALAGNWAADTDLTQSPFVQLGGIVAVANPVGDHRLASSGLLVPRVENTPGAAFHWVDGQGLTAPTFEMPSTWTLIGRTADQMVTDFPGAVQIAISRPHDAARGFFAGAGIALAAGLALPSAAVTATGAVATGTVLNLGNLANEALDPSPCRTERVAMAAGLAILGGGVAGGFTEAGLDGFAGATGVGTSGAGLLSPNC